MEHNNTQLVDEPLIKANIKTRYKCLTNVSCVSGDEVWTSGWDNSISLYNLQGVLMESIQTKSENYPFDIAVTKTRDLVYANVIHRFWTVNIMKNKQKATLVTIEGWRPTGVCSTASNDILVVMVSDDVKQTKVVRYSGSIRKQTIQYNSKGKPLYSSDLYTKYITENGNLDICVSDHGAQAVVVVNQGGDFRFTYTGPPSTTDEPFNPVGIATDRQSRILTADPNNNRIHILDQDGKLLRYIDSCHLRGPWGLCVDSLDNLIVGELPTSQVKKTLYLENRKGLSNARQ